MADGTIYDELTNVTTDKKFALGTKRVEGGKTYHYCQIHASSTAAGAVNKALYRYASATPWVCNTTVTLARAMQFVGVCLTTVAVGSYCWVCTSADDIDVFVTSGPGANAHCVDWFVFGASGDGQIAAYSSISGAGTTQQAFCLGTTNASSVSSETTGSTIKINLRGSL